MPENQHNPKAAGHATQKTCCSVEKQDTCCNVENSDTCCNTANPDIRCNDTNPGTCCNARNPDACKIKARTAQEYKDLIHRLNRIEGQVRGIKGMVEKDAYCTDILVQVAAVNAALNSFNKVLLANHIKTCVTRDIRDGKEETVDELVAVLQRLMR